MMPRTAWITAAGKRLEAQIWGEPSAHPTAVFLHEGLGSVALWRTFPGAVHEATGWPVVAYSRAGHGRSEAAEFPRPLDWMMHEAVEVLPDVLVATGVGSAVLVGHSDGATIAALHAAYGRDRHKMLGVVLMAPHFFTEDMGLAEIARTRAAFDKSDLPERMAKYHDDAEAMFNGWAGAWLDPAFRAWNVEDALDRIAVPVLAIQGREDPYGTLAQIEAVTERAADARALILDGCGHAPHLEQPEAVLSEIEKMCNKMHKNSCWVAESGRNQPDL